LVDSADVPVPEESRAI